MKDLTKTTRHILAQIIEDEGGTHGCCDRSQESLAEECGCTVRTVATAIATLKADNTLWVQPGDDRPHGRGRMPNRQNVNWEHARFNGCWPPRKFPNARAASCSKPVPVGVLQEKGKDNLRSTSSVVQHCSVYVQQPAELSPEEPKAATEPAPEVAEALVELGVAPSQITQITIGVTPLLATALLAAIREILRRGRIHNPAGLAVAVFRRPEHFPEHWRFLALRREPERMKWGEGEMTSAEWFALNPPDC